MSYIPAISIFYKLAPSFLIADGPFGQGCPSFYLLHPLSALPFRDWFLLHFTPSKPSCGCFCPVTIILKKFPFCLETHRSIISIMCDVWDTYSQERSYLFHCIWQRIPEHCLNEPITIGCLINLQNGPCCVIFCPQMRRHRLWLNSQGMCDLLAQGRTYKKTVINGFHWCPLCRKDKAVLCFNEPRIE